MPIYEVQFSKTITIEVQGNSKEEIEAAAIETLKEDRRLRDFDPSAWELDFVIQVAMSTPAEYVVDGRGRIGWNPDEGDEPA